jgi:hypothetical protein
VGHAAQAVELDVVLGRVLAEHLGRPFAQVVGVAELRREGLDGARRRLQQLAHVAVALRVVIGRAALLDLVQAVVQGLDQHRAAARVVEQVILQVRVALNHPDVAQHLVQHAGRAAGLALFAQLVQHLPGAGAQQADDDFPVGKRGVVVRNLAQTRRAVGQLGGAGEFVQGSGCVHRISGRAARAST